MSKDTKTPTQAEKQTTAEQYGNLEAVKKSRDLKTVADRDQSKDAALHRASLEQDVARRRLENKSLEQNHKDQKKNRKMRFDYSKWVFRYLVWYSVFVGMLLILAGFKCWGFELDSGVLQFLVGSTAVSAIGLVAAVVAGLFNRSSKD